MDASSPLEPAEAAAILAREAVDLTEYAVPLRYEDLLDAEPLDRDATVDLVNGVGRWAEAQLPA